MDQGRGRAAAGCFVKVRGSTIVSLKITAMTRPGAPRMNRLGFHVKIDLGNRKRLILRLFAARHAFVKGQGPSRAILHFASQRVSAIRLYDALSKQPPDAKA